LRIEIQIQEVERLILRDRKCLQGGGSDAVHELRQGRVRHQRNVSFAEVIIIQAKDAIIRTKPQFMSAMRPGEIVIDEKTSGASSLHPGVVLPADVAEGRIRPLALQNNRESRERHRIVARREKAPVPGESWIEIVHQVL
jgi:hypothetical protein